MNSLSSISLSGLNAAMLRLDAAGNNIANAQTPGFRRQSVLQSEDAGGGVTASIGRESDPGENLAAAVVEQVSAVYSFKANLRVIQAQDEMMGSLVDLKA